jgi:hypothetical protein
MKSVAIVCCLAGSVLPLNSGVPFAMKVSPTIAPAPAFVRVEATVERDSDNRSLTVTAQSDDFYRSSEIQLDGASGPRVHVIEFSHLPSGVYEVTAILVGQQGRRATARRLVRVAPTPGQRN